MPLPSPANQDTLTNRSGCLRVPGARLATEICKAGVTTEGHCCHLGSTGVCPALRDDGPGVERRWVCTFRERLGSWRAVHADPTYLATIAPVMFGLTGVYCGDWPRPNELCGECGVTG